MLWYAVLCYDLVCVGVPVCVVLFVWWCVVVGRVLMWGDVSCCILLCVGVLCYVVVCYAACRCGRCVDDMV